MAAEFAARYLGLTGPRYTISTACSSSANAFARRARLLAAGRCDAAVVGGADSLCRLTLNGFDALESLSPELCNPFSRNRRGINIGEGACVFLVTRTPSAVRLCGVGESSDGYHMSAPDPDGRGAEIAIRAALAQAGLQPADVGYVNLHGTATLKNDEMESRVVARVFGTATPCGSTKSLIGHTLGAAGAQELGLCWLLLDGERGRRLPPHLWDGVSGPAAARDRPRRRGPRVGARRIRFEFVRVRRQQHRRRDRHEPRWTRARFRSASCSRTARDDADRPARELRRRAFRRGGHGDRAQRVFRRRRRARVGRHRVHGADDRRACGIRGAPARRASERRLPARDARVRRASSTNFRRARGSRSAWSRKSSMPVSPRSSARSRSIASSRRPS